MRMRKFYFLFALLFFSLNFTNAQLLQWNTFGNTGAETTEPSVFNDPNISAANLSQGTITAAANGNRFGGSGWFNTGNTTGGNTLSEAVAGNDYIQFVVTPNAGFSFTPTSFVFVWDRSGTGPSGVTLRSSADGFASDLGTITGIVSSAFATNTITISGLSGLTTATTFRLYGYGASATGGTGGFDINSNVVNVQLNGTTAAVAGNTITTGAVATSPFCVDASASASGTVAFTSTGTFTSSTFTAELSDASGSFASPVTVGSTSVTGTNPTGSINITIPSGTATGSGYLIRVVSGSPSVTGSSSTAFNIINGLQNVTGLAATAASSSSANVSWVNPASCFDEIMIVAKETASVTASPAGNGSSYTADLNYTGSGSSFDGGKVVYKGTSSPQTITGLTQGTFYYIKVFTRRGSSWSSGVEASCFVSAVVEPGDILINQLSPDYNGASDEYIELINVSNKVLSLATLQIKYQSGGGGAGTAGGVLSGTILPHQFWLLSPNGTVTVGSTNLTADGSFTAGFASASGQVALVRISDNTIIDAVGYGTITGGTFTETAAAAAPPADGGIKRITDGGDTNNNLNDFATVANGSILLRNSTVNAPLPVRLANVKAVHQNTYVLVQWSNLTEEDVAYYEVERSANGRTFEVIGKINASSNNGGAVEYMYKDAAPLNGQVNFYRIKSVENSGLRVFSSVVKLVILANAKAAVNVYPNPVTNKTAVLQFSNLAKGNYSVEVYNTTGVKVFATKIAHGGGSASETLALPATLQKGMYRFVIANETDRYGQMIIIQ
ncbi:MAG: lamin tail domain-containing protein [Lacibacter sp.]